VLLALLDPDRARPAARWSWETILQGAAVAAALWVVFGIEPAHAERFFYVLFLPLIWIAMRHGIRGATWALLAIELGIVGAVQIQGLASATLLELQVFTVALAITGLFLGAVVTERRRAGEALEAREAELQRSLRLAAAAETASALAHELNQPLSAIATYVRACAILAERPEENRARLVETMGTVTSEVARAGDVVRRLREFFRSGASRLEHVSVARLLAAAAERAAARLERHRIALTVTCDPALAGVLVDRLQIETVLHNLLANAIDAIIAAEPAERAIVMRAARDARGAVRITVRDSGPGLPGGMPADTFPPFATTKPHGMGLGLAISRSIVESHGGRLVADPVDRGASFSFTLPAEEAIDKP
jgi:C4-dicarboxylate-specific signal transduction histidine kinase